MKLWNSKTTPGLKIIIVGCGKVGVALTEQLSKEGHEITLIDKNATRVQETALLLHVSVPLIIVRIFLIFVKN